MREQKQNRKQQKANHLAQEAVDAYVNTGEKTDVLGSYTGRPADANATPVQDADDL